MAPNPALNAGLLAEARAMRSAGVTVADLARKYGVPRTTLGDRLREDVGAEGPWSEADDGEIPIIVRDYSHLDYLHVIPLGDVHKGSERHLAGRWREWLKYIEDDENTSMLGMGDFLNAALKDSKSEAYDEVMTVGRAKRELRGELRGVADAGRLDALCPGNHEARIYRAVGDCPIEDLADTLGVPYFNPAAIIVYRVGDVEYQCYARHGTGTGQGFPAMSKGALVVPNADFHVTGHVHNQACRTDEYFAVEDERVVRRRRYFVTSGSFLAYEKYAGERGYVPTRIGAPRIRLDGRRKDVHCSL